MNYIDITQSVQALKLNLNGSFGDIDLLIYTDGSDTLITESSSEVYSYGYYQEIELDSAAMSSLKDETQYNLVGIFNSKVVYRGKFQTTSKDILDYSINENKYTQKINSTNYTILD